MRGKNRWIDYIFQFLAGLEPLVDVLVEEALGNFYVLNGPEYYFEGVYVQRKIDEFVETSF